MIGPILWLRGRRGRGEKEILQIESITLFHHTFSKIGLKGCIAMVFVASPVRNCAEIYVDQCSKNLTSSINKLDNKIIIRFSLPIRICKING